MKRSRPKLEDNLFLTGFMGAGKTTVGRELAAALNRRLVDMDTELTRILSRTPAELFAAGGEPEFRRAETALLGRLARRERLVVATGGGTPVYPRNRRLMAASGWVIHLAAGLEECRGRLDPEAVRARPMWRDPAAAARLLRERAAAYEENDLKVRVDRRPEEIAAALRARLFPEASFTARLGSRPCPVKAVWDGPARLAGLTRGRKVMILTDRNLTGRNGAGGHLERYLRALGPASTTVLSPGERTKSLATAQRLFQRLLDLGFDRDDLLVGLGGGMITDLAAFVAGTYKRGLGHVLVSTSLLGCVDAAVGGKAAVNLGTAKNMVGCFTVPEAVLLDGAALATLPGQRLKEGLVEAYKTGLAADPDLARLIGGRLRALLAGDLPALMEVVRLSARAKAAVVKEDFRESGRRKILNLGHTFGHAVESWHRFRVGHGRAVAVGLLAALALSQGRGLLSPEEAEELSRPVRRLWPGRLELPPLGEAWELMSQDKKIASGRLIFVLLKAPGEPVLVDDLGPEELGRALAWVDGRVGEDG